MEDWKQNKQEHIRLSDKAADEYDKLYAASNFATGSYMDYELKIIDRAIELIDKHHRHIAYDLGCGTGRDSLYFNKHFTQVHGYDFSPEMIRVANRKKINKPAGNLHFILRDLEEDLLTDTQNATITFVNSGFGMGSFVEELSLLLREIRRILEPSGVFVISFYNRESLVVQLDSIEWTPSLAAKLDSATGYLKVNFKGEQFNIPVRAYTIKEVREMLGSYFDIVEISTFPTLSSLFPNSLFQSEKARQLCTFVDDELRLNDQIAGGPYIVAVCRKRGKLEADTETLGYLKIMEMLKNNRILPNIKEHAPVMSPDDVSRVLGVEKDELVKSILIKVSPIEKPDSPAKFPTKYYALALQSSRKMDFAKVAHILEVKREQIAVASATEVEELTGFTIGGIPPFGYPRHINVLFDEKIRQFEMVYCGTGKRTESLRISVQDLIKLATPLIADISKE